ncbi:hypothetical protein LINPERHAP2_LOCUS16861 [Linum perenne]
MRTMIEILTRMWMEVVRQIVDHSLVKNTTRILHLHKNLHLSRIDEISLDVWMMDW